jgi:hypothetical protein
MGDKKRNKPKTGFSGKVTGGEMWDIILYTVLYWGGYGVLLMMADFYLPESIAIGNMEYPLRYVLTQVGFALGIVFVGLLYAHYRRR